MTTDRGRTVLMLEPPFGADARDACVDHLASGERPTAALSVLYSEPVGERMDLIERHGDAIDTAAIVCVGPAGDGSRPHEDHSAVHTLTDPADLTGLGIAITNWLDARQAAATTTVCLDSLSTLLQYVDHDRALKFLHTITSRFRRTGVRAHFHLDPRAHDEQTVAQLRQVFDEQRKLEGGAVADSGATRPVATDGGETADEPMPDGGEGGDGWSLDGDGDSGAS